MRLTPPIGMAATLALLAPATPALADLTAVDVWTEWKNLASSFDQTIETESETQSGNVLTIRGFSSTIALPEDGGTVTGTLDEIVFEERGDGTVSITMSPEYPFTMTGLDPEGGEASLDMVIRQTGLTIVVSGEPGTTSYDYLAPELQIALDGMEVDDEAIDLVMQGTMDTVTGSYSVTEAVPRQIDSTFAAEEIAVTFSGTDPEGNGDSVRGELTYADVTSSSTSTGMTFANMADLAGMLSAGFTSSGGLSHGAASYTINGTGPDGTFNLDGAAASGSIEVALAPEGVRYTVANTGTILSFSGSDIPFPQVGLTIAESGGEFRMPIQQSDTPQDFGLKLDLVDLGIDEAIWSLFDPAESLPRDPATLILDIAGTGFWNFDITNPDAAVEFESSGGMPGEVQSLDLQSLLLRVVGAELTGSGAFTFDNTDLSTFDGMPAPDGAIDLQLTGANGLLDTLVAMGLLPDDQAMGARMMLGLFARPGDGPDTLVSRIEVLPDGSVSANGQRLR
ncbi:MAG: DUF2125 domain-containing protein [Pseudomonadota bacterium]